MGEALSRRAGATVGGVGARVKGRYHTRQGIVQGGRGVRIAALERPLYILTAGRSRASRPARPPHMHTPSLPGESASDAVTLKGDVPPASPHAYGSGATWGDAGWPGGGMPWVIQARFPPPRAHIEHRVHLGGRGERYTRTAAASLGACGVQPSSGDVCGSFPVQLAPVAARGAVWRAWMHGANKSTCRGSASVSSLLAGRARVGSHGRYATLSEAYGRGFSRV